VNFQLFVPEIILAGTAGLVILVDLFVERKGALAVLAVLGALAAIGYTITLWGGSATGLFGGRLAVDSFALFFKLLILGIVVVVVLATSDYASKMERFQGEYYALVLTSALGMMVMSAATELITIYVGLELASISLYALVGFLKDPKSTESSLKYLLLGAVASAVMLYGMALIFGVTGQTQLSAISSAIGRLGLSGALANPALVMGVVLLLAGFGFKIATVPFHMWVPDVYEGAPTPITAYLSVGSKAAGFALVLRVFSTAFGEPGWLSQNWGMLFAILAAISMTLGNTVAIPQTNIKRMLGYSSIAQAGYLMVGLAAAGLAGGTDTLGGSGVLFFLASYALTNLGAFVAIIAITNKIGSDLIQDFSGMGRRAPLTAGVLTLCLISLIGMPPAAGFMAKFYIFSGAVQNGLLWLVIVAAINSVVSAYYYLRVVKVMWFGEPASAEPVPSSGAMRVGLAVTSLGVLFVGIAPGFLLTAAQAAARIFTS